MEIYFNPECQKYQVFDGSHEDGEPEYEDPDFMKCVTYRTTQEETRKRIARAGSQ